ncbi:MAG TPA: DUF192 domain-containing protein [Acidimicrobiales bacterium]
MAWLVTADGHVLASADIAATGRARRKGLLGRDGLEGALVLPRTRWIHTIGMRFEIDVAYLDAEGAVIKTVHMRRNHMGTPVWRARTVVEAEAGSFGRWGLHVGDVIEIRE